MPMTQDYMGLGMASQLASMAGNDPNAVTAAGTTQATATTIKQHLVEITATGSDGVIFPSLAKIGTPYFVYNSSGSTGKVYVPVGHSLNGTLNSSLSMTTTQRAIFWQYKRNNWTYVLSA